MLNELLKAGAEAFVRAELTTFLNQAVKEGKLTTTDEAYIIEGAIRSIDFGLKEWQSQPRLPHI
jgi:uridine phosphorylase